MVAAGIEEIIFVTSNGKRALEDHFDRSFELEYRLLQKGKQKEYDQISKICKLAKFAFVRQDEPLGDGHAVLSALPFIDVDEPVLLCFGDEIVTGKPGLAQQLVDVYAEHGEPVIGVYEVSKAQTSLYGIAGGKPIGNGKDGLWRVSSFIEKPAPEKAPSNLAWQGSAILTHDVLSQLKGLKPALGGEIRNTDAFKKYFEGGKTMLAHIIKNPHFDCGNKLQFVKAQIHFGLQNPEMKDDLRAYIKSL